MFTVKQPIASCWHNSHCSKCQVKQKTYNVYEIWTCWPVSCFDAVVFFFILFLCFCWSDSEGTSKGRRSCHLRFPQVDKHHHHLLARCLNMEVWKILPGLICFPHLFPPVSPENTEKMCMHTENYIHLFFCDWVSWLPCWRSGGWLMTEMSFVVEVNLDGRQNLQITSEYQTPNNSGRVPCRERCVSRRMKTDQSDGSLRCSVSDMGFINFRVGQKRQKNHNMLLFLFQSMFSLGAVRGGGGEDLCFFFFWFSLSKQLI